MRMAIMQPYFWPYLGYFQLIHSAEIFVIYDNIQFTKSGWIHRNRILVNGKDCYVTLPLQKASDYLDIRERRLVPDFRGEADAILRRLRGAYVKAPFLAEGLAFAEEVLMTEESNLFLMLHRTVLKTMEMLEIDRKVVVSSSLSVDRSLIGEARVMRTCELLGADEYINSPGGRQLYSREAFGKRQIGLVFLEPQIRDYTQMQRTDFLPNLSIIDMIMSVGWQGVRERLTHYRVDPADR